MEEGMWNRLVLDIGNIWGVGLRWGKVGYVLINVTTK